MTPPEVQAVSQQCGKLQVKPSPLEITGTLGDASSFVAPLKLKARKAGLKPVFIPSALRSQDQVIGPGLITVNNLSEDLPVGQFRAVNVSVGDVRFAGEYHGTLEAADKCSVPVTLIAVAPADLSLVGGADNAFHANLVRCANSTCGPGLGDFLIPHHGASDQLRIQVANASQSPALVTGLELALRSDDPSAGSKANLAFRPTETAFLLPAQAAATLPAIEVDRDSLEPGHYVGAIYLSTAGSDKRTALPLEVDVRDGPFWAVIALVLALLIQALGRVGAAFRPRRVELRKWRQLRRRIGLLDPKDQELLKPRLDELRQLVLHGDLDEAKKEREALEKDVGRLKRARGSMARRSANSGEHPSRWMTR